MNKTSGAPAGTFRNASTSYGSGAPGLPGGQSRPPRHVAAAIARLRALRGAGAGHDALAAELAAEAVDVRCLACGALYHRSLLLHDCVTSSGCPRCGYVGWATAVR